MAVATTLNFRKNFYFVFREPKFREETGFEPEVRSHVSLPRRQDSSISDFYLTHTHDCPTLSKRGHCNSLFSFVQTTISLGFLYLI